MKNLQPPKLTIVLLGLLLGFAGCGQTRPLAVSDRIQIEVIAPQNNTQLSVSASIVENRLAIGGSVNRPLGKVILGRVYIEMLGADGSLLESRSAPLAVVGPRLANRRVFSLSFDRIPQPGSRIKVSYHAAAGNRVVSIDTSSRYSPQ